MDIKVMLSDLRSERQRIDQAIRALEVLMVRVLVANSHAGSTGCSEGSKARWHE